MDGTYNLSPSPTLILALRTFTSLGNTTTTRIPHNHNHNNQPQNQPHTPQPLTQTHNPPIPVYSPCPVPPSLQHSITLYQTSGPAHRAYRGSLLPRRTWLAKTCFPGWTYANGVLKPVSELGALVGDVGVNVVGK